MFFECDISQENEKGKHYNIKCHHKNNYLLTQNISSVLYIYTCMYMYLECKVIQNNIYSSTKYQSINNENNGFSFTLIYKKWQDNR